MISENDFILPSIVSHTQVDTNLSPPSFYNSGFSFYPSQTGYTREYVTKVDLDVAVMSDSLVGCSRVMAGHEV
jgi:hypothetical protein